MTHESDEEPLLSAEKPEEPKMTSTAFAYSVYVLLLLTTAYLLNQLDRYMISVCTKPMAQDIHYGDQVCSYNSSMGNDLFSVTNCNATTESSCDALAGCVWDYNGQGIEYEILAGPVFIVVYTLMGIPVSFLADNYSRKIILACFLTFWSLMSTLTGLATQYWHLVVLRFLLGFAQAGCTPLATSLLTDYFQPQWRATAIGVYNIGIYFGYSLSYAVGNFVSLANINGQGWRWAFYISGFPGLVVGPLILLTVKEPARQVRKDPRDAEDLQGILGRGEEVSTARKLLFIGKTFLSPSLLLLCLGGSLRNGAGYVWAYNTQPYYESIGQRPDQIGSYMSWIPLVGGSIGVILGGFISDKVVKKVGPFARLFVLIASQVIAAPFVTMAIYLHPPVAYYMLIPGYVFGEMWVGICLAIVVELVPTPLRTSAVAVYLFIISNIGGNMALLVPYLQQAFIGAGNTTLQSLRYTLLVLYPGMYIAGAVFFIFTLLSMRRDLRKAREYMSLGGDE